MHSASVLRHVRPVRPLRFREQEPEDEHLGQSRRHLHLCKALYEILRAAVPLDESTVGADQFVYFRANDARRCLAPDVFVKVDRPDADFGSWKTWEWGAPELAFEILSPSDTEEMWSVEEKLGRYHELGVQELVLFDVDAPPGERLRVWDRIDGDFLERVVEDERTPCVTLGLYVVVAPVLVDESSRYPVCVRLSRTADGSDLVSTAAEARRDAELARQDAELARQNAELARRDAELARQDAESRAAAAAARVAELEAELARKR